MILIVRTGETFVQKAFSGPRKAIREKILIRKFLPLIINISAEANLNRDLLLFPLEGRALC